MTPIVYKCPHCGQEIEGETYDTQSAPVMYCNHCKVDHEPVEMDMRVKAEWL